MGAGECARPCWGREQWPPWGLSASARHAHCTSTSTTRVCVRAVCTRVWHAVSTHMHTLPRKPSILRIRIISPSVPDLRRNTLCLSCMSANMSCLGINLLTCRTSDVNTCDVVPCTGSFVECRFRFLSAPETEPNTV